MRMKTAIALLLAIILAAGAAFGALAQQDGEPVRQYLGTEMPDFTVTDIDGNAFTLSEALKEKELVLVNFWATWCPPCRLEFPFMQMAYEKYRDKAAIVALSVEPADTDNKLRKFAEEKGITFSVAQDDKGLANQLRVSAYPTTLLIDRFGRIVYVELCSIPDEKLFESLFDLFLGDGYTESKPRQESMRVAEGYYSIVFIDKNIDPVPGCEIAFCTDTESVTVVSNTAGAAVFEGAPGVYRLRVISLPEGFAMTQTGDLYTDSTGGVYILQLVRPYR